MAKRAVIWLSEKVGRAILRLEESDFHRHYLHDLVSAWPDVDALCLRVFEDLRKRIWYQDQLPKSEKVIVFSPHPDDDVISMGGMLDKLAGNGNEITVAYMTNGSVAVFDADVRRHLHFLEMGLSGLRPLRGRRQYPGSSSDAAHRAGGETARICGYAGHPTGQGPHPVRRSHLCDRGDGA